MRVFFFFFNMALSCIRRTHKWFRGRILEFEKSTYFIRRHRASCGDMQSHGKEPTGVIHLIFYTDSTFSVILLKQTLKEMLTCETHGSAWPHSGPPKACCISLHWRDRIAALGDRCQTPSLFKIQFWVKGGFFLGVGVVLGEGRSGKET